MSTEKHTPTPWHTGDANFRSILGPKTRRYNKDGRLLLINIATVSQSDDDDEDAANAAFIVEACNQHAALKLREKALVEACLLALELIRNHFPLEHGDPKIAATWGALESAIEKCRLAFALPLANAGPNLKAGQIRSGHHSSK